MELFEWPEELETGIALLDEQHQSFLRQVNRFYIKFRFKQQKESAEEQLDFLQNYLLSHFQAELAFMLEHGYPKARDHQASHQMLAIQVKQQALELKAQDYSPESVEAFCRFVGAWASQHIMQEDMEFCRFLRAAR